MLSLSATIKDSISEKIQILSILWNVFFFEILVELPEYTRTPTVYADLEMYALKINNNA